MPDTRGQNFRSFGRPFPEEADRATLEQLQRRTPRVAGYVEVHHGSDGITMTPLRPVQEPEFSQPLHPLGLKTKDDGNTDAYLRPGYVLLAHVERKDEQTGGLSLEDILIEGTNSIWEEPPPPLALANNHQYTYITWNTNDLGNPITNFNIFSYEDEHYSNYHIPPDADGTNGSNGVYYVELFRTDLDSDDWHSRLERKWGGHLPWQPDALWAGIHQESNANTSPNIGRPYIAFEEDINRYLFRSHTQGHGHNIHEYSSNILHQFCGRNIGTGSSNYANVYTGNTQKDCAEFNIIKERDTGSQVKVIQTGNESPILVRGNYNDVTISFKHSNGSIAANLVFRDGLIIAPTSDTTIVMS